TNKEELKEIIADELNVRVVSLNKTGDDGIPRIQVETKLTPELKREGMMREVIRHIQSARKAAGLQVDDRIQLVLTANDKTLQKAIDEHLETIQQETLTKTIAKKIDDGYQANVKVDDAELTVALKK